MGFSEGVGGVARLAVVIAAIAAASPSVADEITAVTTPGTGVLTKCRNWLVYKSCNSYSKVELPKRIAIGDKLQIRFGSNQKAYTFPVGGIRREGDSCKILSAATDGAEDDENIVVLQCRPAAATASN